MGVETGSCRPPRGRNPETNQSTSGARGDRPHGAPDYTEPQESDDPTVALHRVEPGKETKLVLSTLLSPI